jgi:hypothetical protein
MTNATLLDDQPRATNGTFGTKQQTPPGVTLSYTDTDPARDELRAFAAARGLSVGTIFGAPDVRNLLDYELAINEADLSVNERKLVVDETVADPRFASIPTKYGELAEAQIHSLLREKIRDHGGAGEQRGVIEPATDLSEVINLLKANGCVAFATSASMAGSDVAAADVLDADIFALHSAWTGRHFDWERVSRWMMKQLRQR